MSLPSYRRTSRQRLSLMGEVCPHCERKLFPPRDHCPDCGGPAKQPFQFSGQGEVYSFCTLFNAPLGYAEQAPYVAALIKLAEGPLVTAQLTDVSADAVYIGMPVEMVTRRMRAEGEEGLIHYGYKFRPVLQAMAQSAQ